ncbi:MAG: hypothetical protein RLY86_2172 [Pseudomonadota bacterium]|jgi:hypothetical protein
MPFKPITDDAYAQAVAEAERQGGRGLRAEQVRYDRGRDAVEVQLSPRFTFAVPRSLLTEWDDATADAFEGVRLSALGDALILGDHDVYISVLGLLESAVGGTVLNEMFGRRGGRARSPAKARAARANGALGGRPRKVAGGA